MRELDIKEEDLVYADKDSARKMQQTTQSKMPGILAIFLTIGFFGSMATMMFIEVPAANQALVYSMVGSLGAAWLGSMQFYFGTTKSSQNKTEMMNK